MEKAIIVLSGGQDSTTCAFWGKHRGLELHAVTFDYGQRHQREVDAARIVGDMVGLASHEFICLPRDVLSGTSPLVSDAPLEQYRDHASLPGGLEKTFVPMRNQLFFTIAANRAYCIGAQMLITGVCQEDNGGYPDCTDGFIHNMEHACNSGAFTGVDGAPDGLRILTPLMDMTKADSVRLALSLPGCYEALQFSHTSYDGAYPPTGHDHATLLRAKGFEEAGVPDPLVLRAWHDNLMELPMSDNYRPKMVELYARQWLRLD